MVLRKVVWASRVLYNLVRMPLLWIFTLGRIKFSILEFISPNTILRVGNGGTINFGKRCMLDYGTMIRSSGGKIHIGDRVYMNRNCNVVARESIVIGNEVTIGPNVCIYDHDHTFGENKSSNYKVDPIIIGDNVWIGANVVILRGTKINNDCVIGAGTIVKGNIPAKKMVVRDGKLIYYDIK